MHKKLFLQQKMKEKYGRKKNEKENMENGKNEEQVRHTSFLESQL